MRFGLAALLLWSGCAASHGLEDAPETDPGAPVDVRSVDAPRDACRASTETCNDRDDDCDGSTDEESCSLPFARSACAAATCVFLGCEDGHLDCDGDGSTGCEVDASADRQNCGGCGVACGMTETCEESTCVRERIVDVSIGAVRACAVLGSGRVLCWGGVGWDDAWDYTPFLGETGPVPFEVEGFPPDVVQVEAYSVSVLIRTRSGEVWGWGDNSEGQLATGSAGLAYSRSGREVLPGSYAGHIPGSR